MSTAALDRASDAAPTPLERALRAQMPVLDALRGVAIALVLLHRFNVTKHPSSIVARAIADAMELGWAGVQLFFVLSGFLITGILLDTRDGAGYYRVFFARRVLRIFPLYYAALAAAFIVAPLVIGQATGHENQLWLWVYLSNWVEPFGLGVAAFPHFWSLAVEEQFYFVWPWVVRAARGRALPILCAVLIVVAFAARLALRLLHVNTEAPYQWTICRFDALALGALAAWALRVPAAVRAIDARRGVVAAVTVLVLVVGAVATRGYPRVGFLTQTFGYSLIAWAAVVLLVSCVLAEARGERLASLVSLGPLRSLGKYSYGMYVFHVPLHRVIGVRVLKRLGLLDPSIGVTLVYTVVMFAFTYVVAVASYHLYEKHFLGLKRRFVVARMTSR
jgi:peptidoglycan/LPS O-acetylase OafA/YrhL